jgi:hypothetical protein
MGPPNQQGPPPPGYNGPQRQMGPGGPQNMNNMGPGPQQGPPHQQRPPPMVI